MSDSLLMAGSIFKQQINVTVTPYKDLESTTIQGQLEELEDEKSDLSHNHDITQITSNSHALSSQFIDNAVFVQALFNGALI